MTDSLRDAYNEPSDELALSRERKRRRSLAATYRYDARLELLARQLDRDPDRPTSPALRLSLGSYLNSKAAAEAEGIDTGDNR